MKWLSSTISIDVAPRFVWALLSDAEGWGDWCPEVVRLEGTLAADAQVRWVQERGPVPVVRETEVQVLAFEPNEKLALSSTEGAPELLYRWVRTFSLAPRPGGRTELSQVLEVDGLLHDLWLLADPDRQAWLVRTGEALKAHAEQGQAT